MTPTKCFLTKGIGVNKDPLRAFESSLRSAGIQICNLVYVSSIFPSGCRIIPKNQGVSELVPGAITFCVLARTTSNEPNRLISSSVGLAIPVSNKSHYGYLSEVHDAFGKTRKETGDHAEDLAAAMLCSTLGLEFDENKSWNEKKDLYQVGDKIIKTSNITQSTVVKGNNYHTVIAAAIFIE
jgi:arginine decarboxylase